jgi:hypothetical protein
VQNLILCTCTISSEILKLVHIHVVSSWHHGRLEIGQTDSGKDVTQQTNGVESILIFVNLATSNNLFSTLIQSP